MKQTASKKPSSCLLVLVFWGVPLFAAALRQVLLLFLPVVVVSFLTAVLIAVPIGVAVARVTYHNVLRLYERQISSAPYTYKDMTQLVLTQDEKTYVKKKLVGEKARA